MLLQLPLSPFIKQTWAVLGVLLGILTCGFHLGYTSSLLEDLKRPDSPIKIDASTASWLVSSIGPSNLIGFLYSSSLMAWIGRRNAFITLSVPAIISWLLICLAQDISLLMLGRLFGGVAIGGTILIGSVIIGEYSSPKYRSMFLIFNTTAICLGSTIVHLLGSEFHWKTIAWISMVFQVLSLAITFTVPESPHWLACNKRYFESEAAFFWLRGDSYESKQEINEIIRLQQEYGQQNWMSKHFNKFTNIDFFKPIAIVFFSFILLESSGRHFFPAYASQIMEELLGNKTNSYIYTLGMDLTITVSMFASSMMVRVMRMRTLLFSTGFAAAFTVYAASTCVFMMSNGLLSESLSWLPLSFFVIFFVLVNLGCTSIPLVLLGEIFPLKHRPAGAAIAGVIASFCMWTTMKTFPHLLETTKIYGTFGLFGLLQTFSLMVLYFILPETKDRTLEEIEYYFKDGCFKNEEIDEEISIIEKTEL